MATSERRGPVWFLLVDEDRIPAEVKETPHSADVGKSELVRVLPTGRSPCLTSLGVAGGYWDLFGGSHYRIASSFVVSMLLLVLCLPFHCPLPSLHAETLPPPAVSGSSNAIPS